MHHEIKTREKKMGDKRWEIGSKNLIAIWARIARGTHVCACGV